MARTKGLKKVGTSKPKKPGSEEQKKATGHKFAETIHISRQLLDRMHEHPDVDWSLVAQCAFENKLQELGSGIVLEDIPESAAEALKQLIMDYDASLSTQRKRSK